MEKVNRLNADYQRFGQHATHAIHTLPYYVRTGALGTGELPVFMASCCSKISDTHTSFNQIEFSSEENQNTKRSLSQPAVSPIYLMASLNQEVKRTMEEE
ncbi:hypothetical protein SK128_016270 [Halocaridina rubra]|uniref:Uncharacterized protein n=1 Tax=Halocaridina rubra TaxID=373956 RepID=A0AAN8X4N7_HALRR